MAFIGKTTNLQRPWQYKQWRSQLRTSVLTTENRSHQYLGQMSNTQSSIVFSDAPKTQKTTILPGIKQKVGLRDTIKSLLSTIQNVMKRG